MHIAHRGQRYRVVSKRIKKMQLVRSQSSVVVAVAFAAVVLLAADVSGEVVDGAKQLEKGTVRAPCGVSRLERCTFVDRFGFFNGKMWMKSVNYANDYPFYSWWSGTSAFVNAKKKTLALSITKNYNPKFGLEYASGEVKSIGRYGYGCYEARIRPISQPGAISSFFIHTDTYNAVKGRSKRTNSVNLGFLWNTDLKRMMYRVTYTKDGKPGPVQDVFPRFDVSKSFHNYGFKFTAKEIIWYLDGVPVFSYSRNIPKLNDGPFRIFLNAWVTDPLANFGGRFFFQSRRVTEFAAVRFTRGPQCTFKRFF